MWEGPIVHYFDLRMTIPHSSNYNQYHHMTMDHMTMDHMTMDHMTMHHMTMHHLITGLIMCYLFQ